MRLFILPFFYLVFTLNTLAQEIKIIEWTDSNGSKYISNELMLSESGERLERYQWLDGKKRISRFIKNEEDQTRKINYFIEENGVEQSMAWVDYQFDGEKCIQEVSFSPSGKIARERSYIYKADQIIEVKKWEANPPDLVYGDFKEFYEYNLQGQLKTVEVFLDKEMINRIEHRYTKDQYSIHSYPSRWDMCFEEVFEYEDEKLVTHSFIWGDRKEGVFKKRKGYQRVIKYNKKGLIRSIKVYHYAEVGIQPSLSQTLDYKIESKEKLDPATIEKLNTTILELALEGSWYYEVFDW